MKFMETEYVNVGYYESWLSSAPVSMNSVFSSG